MCKDDKKHPLETGSRYASSGCGDCYILAWMLLIGGLE